MTKRQNGGPEGATERLPVLPLRDVVFFPHVVMPLVVGRAQSLAAVNAASSGSGRLLLVTQRDPDVQEPGASHLYRVGVIARLNQLTPVGNGSTRVLLEGISRARVTRYVTRGGHISATIAATSPESQPDSPELQALVRSVLASFEEYVSLQRRIPGEVVAMIQAAAGIDRQAYGMAAHLAVRQDTRQKLLDAESPEAMLRLLGEVISSENDLLQLERKIDEDVRGSLFQNQREFYLQEQLKAIHRELGNEDDDLAELEAALLKKGLPEPVLARAQRELRRLRRIPPMNPESTVARTFI